jgi:hypothetical protein
MLHLDLAKAHYELVRDVLVLRPARPVTAAANAVEEEHADAAGRFRC